MHESFLDRSLFDHWTGYFSSLDREFLVHESILDRTLFDHWTGYFTPFGPDTFRQKRPDAFVLLDRTLFDFKTGHFSYMDRILFPGTGHFASNDRTLYYTFDWTGHFSDRTLSPFTRGNGCPWHFIFVTRMFVTIGYLRDIPSWHICSWRRIISWQKYIGDIPKKCTFVTKSYFVTK